MTFPTPKAVAIAAAGMIQRAATIAALLPYVQIEAASTPDDSAMERLVSVFGMPGDSKLSVARDLVNALSYGAPTPVGTGPGGALTPQDVAAAWAVTVSRKGFQLGTSRDAGELSRSALLSTYGAKTGKNWYDPPFLEP